MYEKVEGNLRMTLNQASERFPDKYILIQRDDGDSPDQMGTVLYVGDNDDELFHRQMNPHVPYGIVVEGMNLQYSLGGVVVGDRDIF
jgi:hypothetical protein